MTVQQKTEMSPVLTLINTLKPLSSQMIKLAQGHSDRKGHTCTLGSRQEDYLPVFPPLVHLGTAWETLSPLITFSDLPNSYWSFKA